MKVGRLPIAKEANIRPTPRSRPVSGLALMVSDQTRSAAVIAAGIA
jgi:hypothetical protein